MFTCTKKKPAFKNLTVGKEYEGIEDGEMVVVVNDIGARARYSKEYFTGTVAADAPRRGRPPRAAVETPPPPPPPIPMRQAVTVDITRDNNRINLRVVANGRTNNYSLTVGGSIISCGVYEFSGISGIGSGLTEILGALPNNVENRTMDNLIDIVMTALIGYIKTNFRAAFWLCSDAVADDNENGEIELQGWLTTHAISVVTDTNPNSDNVISVWVLGAEGGE